MVSTTLAIANGAAGVEIIRNCWKPANFVDAQALVRDRGLRLMPNIEADRILADKALLKMYGDAFPCWVGTGLIYQRPDKELGEVIIFRHNYDIVTAAIPTAFRRKKNTALALEHPHYAVKKLRSGLFSFEILNESAIVVVEDFPMRSGWYETGPAGMPMGDCVLTPYYNVSARYLARERDSCWVGSLVRRISGECLVNDKSRSIDANTWLEDEFGVAGVSQVQAGIDREGASPAVGTATDNALITSEQFMAAREDYERILRKVGYG